MTMQIWIINPQMLMYIDLGEQVDVFLCFVWGPHSPVVHIRTLNLSIVYILREQSISMSFNPPPITINSAELFRMPIYGIQLSIVSYLIICDFHKHFEAEKIINEFD